MKLLKQLVKTIYFLFLFIFIAHITFRLEYYILFSLNSEIMCANILGFLRIPLCIVLTFCLHIGIRKLYKHYFEKIKLSFNKAQFTVLVCCLVLFTGLFAYSFIANKTILYSDGTINIFDSCGRISDIKSFDEAEKIELKAIRFDYHGRLITTYDYVIQYHLHYPDGTIIELDSESFRDIESMKQLKDRAGDRLIITDTEDTMLEIALLGEEHLFEVYSALFYEEEEDEEKDEDDRYHSYYETFEGTTYYEFGMGGHMIYE